MTAYATLTSEAEVERLLAQPGPAWILKHSTACSISHAAFGEFCDHLAAHPGQPAGVVIIQEQRPLSGWIAQRLGRAHQSPQLFLVRGGTIRWAGTHWSITAAAMDAAWRAYAEPAA